MIDPVYSHGRGRGKTGQKRIRHAARTGYFPEDMRCLSCLLRKCICKINRLLVRGRGLD
nr:MAG TPA: hypothetical protein [Caudoviricetes sp.]